MVVTAAEKIIEDEEELLLPEKRKEDGERNGGEERTNYSIEAKFQVEKKSKVSMWSYEVLRVLTPMTRKSGRKKWSDEENIDRENGWRR